MAGTTTLLTTLIAQVDVPATSVIVAIIGAAVGIIARRVPKTRSEAGVDRSQARVNDAEAWDKLTAQYLSANSALQEDVERLRVRVVRAEKSADEARNALEEERRECDRRISDLERRLEQIAPRRE